jgi:hypothetical protein
LEMAAAFRLDLVLDVKCCDTAAGILLDCTSDHDGTCLVRAWIRGVHYETFRLPPYPVSASAMRGI